jgi:hypothetical protein
MGTTPTVTIDPPQPQGQGEYPITALVPSYIKVFTNQADYFAKTGKVAPAYNPILPVKSWIDSNAQSGSITGMMSYSTAHLDAAGQKPVVTTIMLPAFLATSVNLPPDSGPIPPSTAGSYLVPIRPLLPNEQLIASPFGPNGIGGVANTDVFNPNPPAASTPSSGGGYTDADRTIANQTLALVMKMASGMGM